MNWNSLVGFQRKRASGLLPFLLPCFFLASVWGMGISAADVPVSSPESAGLSSERLARIGTVVQRDIEEKRIAGAVTLVWRRGHLVWFKAQGSMDREANKPMQTDTIFRICSMSKPLTTLAVMMLYEEGRFQLDDPISKYIPEFKNPRVLVTPVDEKPYTIPATKEITIRNLLTHTSGLTYMWNPHLGPIYKAAGVADGLSPYNGTIADSVKRLAAQPLLFNPGSRWEYSLSADVLGYLVEVVSGKSFAEFLRTRIFEPLGMKDTYFYLPQDKVNRLATAYTWYPDKGLSRFPDKPIVEGPFSYTADYPYSGPRKLYSGGAGLSSTAGDYLRFCELMLNGGSLGNVHLISRKSVELMTHDQIGRISPDQGFGLGFGIDGVKSPLTELGTPGQYGWGGFFYTSFHIDPKEQMITIFMGQLHPTGDLNPDGVFHTLAYQAINN